MKKLSILFCAALAALAVISCDKAPKEEPVLAPETQLNNLSNTAISLLKEADPNYWGEFVKRAGGMFTYLGTVEPGNLGFDPSEIFKAEVAEEEESYSLRDDLKNWINSVVQGDNYKLYLTSYRLSLFTGDITVREVNPKAELEPGSEEEAPVLEFVYTRSTNPLNLVFVYDNKTYKFQFEAMDSENNVLNISQDLHKEGEVVTEEDRTEVFVPSKVAVHVTENGAFFIDLVIEPEFKDLNWDNFTNYSDEIRANATVQIPGYTLKATDVQVNVNELDGKLELLHGNTSLLFLDGKIEISPMNLMGSPDNESEPLGIKPRITIPLNYIGLAMQLITKAEGTLKIMGGSVVLDGTIYPKETMFILKELDIPEDEEGARMAGSLTQRYVNVKVFYNNGSRVQSMLVAKPIMQGTGNDAERQWVWGLQFPDQTFKTFQELSESEDFDAVIGQLAIWMAHGNAIFSEEDSVEPEPLHE